MSERRRRRRNYEDGEEEGDDGKSSPELLVESQTKEVDYGALASSLNLKQSGDGEVSLSVEETNNLRTRLGLKPLNASESSSASSARQQAERNYELARSSRREARRVAEIEAELARAKRRREARQQLDGADALTTGDASEFAREVKRSMLEAERRAALLLEQEYGAEDLEGLEVSASAAESLKRGEMRVLTLADEQVLDYDNEKHGKLVGINDGSNSVLENVEMSEAYKRKHALEEARRDAFLARGLPTDDDEFGNGGAFGTGAVAYSLKLGKGGKIDPADQKHLPAVALGVLASAGSDDALPAEGEAAATLKIGKWGAAAQTFTAQREYMTQDEARRLFKKKRKAVPNRQARKPTVAALATLDDIADENDRGSRKEVLERKAREAAAAESRDTEARAAAYEIAKQKQQAKVEIGLGTAQGSAPPQEETSSPATKTAVVVKVEEHAEKPRFVEGIGDDEDDVELRSSLARARMLNTKANTFDPAEAIAERISQQAVLKNEPQEAEAETRADDVVVFTDTTEFTSRLHARLEERAAEVLARQQENQGSANKLPDDSAMDDQYDNASENNDQKDDDDDDEENNDQIEFLHKQPLASKGMAATMSLLKTSGDLNQQVQEAEIMVGRARDQRVFEDGSHRDDHLPDVTFKGQLKPIKLEYRDSDGRLLTRKEAYRHLCWKFHGKGPGVKKLEKAAARFEATQRSIKQSNEAGSFAILQHAQERTGQAYIPISNTVDVANNLLGVPSKANSASFSSKKRAGGSKSSGKSKRHSAK